MSGLLSSAQQAEASPTVLSSNLSADGNTILDALASASHLARDRALLSIPGLSENSVVELRQALPTRLNPDGPWAVTCSALQASSAVLTLPSTSSHHAKEFSYAILPLTLPLISHQEARVRTAVAELCGKIAAVLGPEVWDQTSPELLANVERNFNLDDQQRLNEAQRVAQNDMEKHSSSSLRDRGLRMVHETEGWRGLETSLLAIGELFAGCGAKLLKRPASEKSAEPSVDVVLSYMLRARSHPNRFVREAGLRLLVSIVDACVEANVTSFLIDISWRLRLVVSEGLQDNWSQVRSVSSVAARKIISGLPVVNRRELYPLFLPRMCLNRHYVAEGVRSYSQATWKDVIGSDGRVYLVKLMDEVITFYESQCNADNHAVREAACQSLAEVSTRLDPKAVEPYVSRIVNALMQGFKDESWPVRDHACTALGNVTAHFGDKVEATGRLQELFDLFYAHLADNIVSVRENSSASMVKASLAFPLSHPVLGLKRVGAVDAILLPRIEDQEEHKFGVPTNQALNRPDRDTGYGAAAKLARDNDVDLHTGQVMYSCGSLAPKLRRGGGCMDHGFSRSKEPWEESDGGARLWEQLAISGEEGAKLAGDLFPLVVRALAVAVEREFAHSQHAQESLWRCVAGASDHLPIEAWTADVCSKLFFFGAQSSRSENERVSSAANAAIKGMQRAVGYRAVQPSFPFGMDSHP
jgi:HEAT repeat protein